MVTNIKGTDAFQLLTNELYALQFLFGVLHLYGLYE